MAQGDIRGVTHHREPTSDDCWCRIWESPSEINFFLDFHELIKIHYASSSIVDVFSQNFQNGLKCFWGGGGDSRRQGGLGKATPDLGGLMQNLRHEQST